MIKAVIFDMDGVLIDSEPLHFSAVEAVLNKYGIKIHEGFLNKYVGDTNERVWIKMKEEFALGESIEFYIKQQVECTIECLWRDDYKAIGGVVELLQLLKENGYSIGIASSSPPNVIQSIIERIGINDYIEEWVSGNEVEESKPAPFIYQRAAKVLGFEPAECVAIEDSFYGVAAAKAAGLKCIGYKSPDAIEQDLSAADVMVSKINQVTIELIKGLDII